MKRLLGIIGFVFVLAAAVIVIGGPAQAVPPMPLPTAIEPLSSEAMTTVASGWLEVLSADTVLQVGTASVSPGDDFFVPVTVMNIPPSPNALGSGRSPRSVALRPPLFSSKKMLQLE